MGDEWTTVGKRERRPPRKFDDTFTVSTKPKKPTISPEMGAFLRDPNPKKKKPSYDLPSGIPVDINRPFAQGNGTNGHKQTQQQNNNKKSKAKAVDPPAKQRFTGDKSFEPDVRSVRLTDLMKVYHESQVHFADAPSIWLKDMAAYLNHLLPFQLSEPAFRSRPDPGYPSSLLKNDVRSFIRQILESCANPTLQLFQSHCMETVVRNIGLQLPTAGYLMMLQLMGQEFPDVTHSNIQRFIDARIVNKPRPEVSLTLCWIVLQAIRSDPRHGSSMWRAMMLPMTGSSANSPTVRAYNEFAVHSLETYVNEFSDGSSPSPSFRLTPTEFCAMFDFLSVQRSLPSNSPLVPRLNALFPRLRSLAARTWTSKSATSHSPQKDQQSKQVCEVFSEFLHRLSVGHGARDQVKGVLQDCLLADEQVFSHWRSIHDQGKDVNGSQMLLQHISESGMTGKLNHKAVTETMTYFRASLLGGEKTLQAISAIERKMSKSRVPWKSILLLVIAVTAATIAFDVQKHGSFRKSITGRNLQRYGVVSAWNKSVAKASAYSAVATAWVSKNWPVVRSKVEPWISAAGVKLAIGYKYVSEAVAPAVEPVRQWIVKTVPPLIAHVKDKLLPLAISFLKDLSNAMIAVLVEVGKWVQENLLVGNWSVDNLSRIAAESVTNVQSAAGQAVNWITGHVKALTT